jgi:pyruvate dehydrogenase E2 component (dihydrolipoamide acetyltransferase)
MTEGKVLGWLKGEGDSYRAGEELLEIETSKITNVFEASEPGKLRRIIAPEGATLPIGALLAVAAPDSVPDAEIEAFVAGFVMPEPEAAAAAEDGGWAPRDIEAGGRRLRILDVGAGDGVPVVAGARLRRRPQRLDVQPAVPGRAPPSRRARPAGHGGADKEVGAGDAGLFSAA